MEEHATYHARLHGGPWDGEELDVPLETYPRGLGIPLPDRTVTAADLHLLPDGYADHDVPETIYFYELPPGSPAISAGDVVDLVLRGTSPV